MKMSYVAFLIKDLRERLDRNVRVTSPYGWREGEYAGFHVGTDVGGIARGTRIPVYLSGKILFAGRVNHIGSYGITVFLRPDLYPDYVLQFAHAHDIFVKTGEKVEWGQKIFSVGGSGKNGLYDYGPHIHHEVRRYDPNYRSSPWNMRSGRMDPEKATFFDVNDLNGGSYVSVGSRRHKVVRGETLTTIANDYDTRAYKLVEWNQDSTRGTNIITCPNTIRAGWIIWIEEPPHPKLYEVVSGDTLGKIALQHGVTWQELAEWNKERICGNDVVTDPNRIEVGWFLWTMPPLQEEPEQEEESQQPDSENEQDIAPDPNPSPLPPEEEDEEEPSPPDEEEPSLPDEEPEKPSDFLVKAITALFRLLIEWFNKATNKKEDK